MLIKIDTTGAAFRPRPENEVARVLRELATRIRQQRDLAANTPLDLNREPCVKVTLTAAENPQTTFDF